MNLYLKQLLRSKSLAFANARTDRRDGSVGTVSYGGRPLHFRRGTSDHAMLYEILMKGRKNTYESPCLPAARPGMVVVDVGANIGASVLFFKSRFPDARVYAFEPVPSNFEILKRNAAELPGVSLHMEALGEADGELELIHSGNASNEGGWGFEQPAGELSGREQRIRVPISASGRRLAELGVREIDVLKLDTEGSEAPIVRGLGPLLGRTRVILGELHGKRDFALLDHLEESGFDIGAKKTLGKRLFIFTARRLEAAAS